MSRTFLYIALGTTLAGGAVVFLRSEKGRRFTGAVRRGIDKAIQRAIDATTEGPVH